MDIRTLHSRWSFIVPNISICQYSHISVSYEKYEHTIRNLDKYFILHENYENAISTNPKYLIFSLFCYKLNLSVVLWNKPFIFQEECPLSWKRGNMHANKYFSKHQFTNTSKTIYTFDQNCTFEKKNKTIYLIDLLGTNIDY